MDKDVKLVVIGAGSVYTPELFKGISENKGEPGIREICLLDIEDGMEKAEIICKLGERMFKKSGVRCQLNLTADRRHALRGADFVISQIRVGGVAARIDDEMTGIKLGICGQETTGAGGFLSAARTIPASLAIARDMEDICPDAWLINFTNPSGIVTEAILKHSRVKCVGLCNVPINMHRDIAQVMDIPMEAIRPRFAGLNHLSYVTGVEHDGRDILETAVSRISENEVGMKNIPKVAGVGELIRRLGVIPSPYLQYYYFEKDMIRKQHDEYVRSGMTRGAAVEKIDRELLVKYADMSLSETPPELSQRGGSLYCTAALNLISALLCREPSEMVLNVKNEGAVPGFFDDDVLEINCEVSEKGIKPLSVKALPEAAAGLVRSIKQYERLTVRSVIDNDPDLALAALLNHPLIHGYFNAAHIIGKITLKCKK